MARAGDLTSRVKIQRSTLTYSETNEAIEHWATIATRWGEVKALSGTEAVKARALQAEATYQITMRQGFEILPTDRLVCGSQIFNLLSVIPQDEWLLMLGVQSLEETYNCASLTARATLSATAE